LIQTLGDTIMMTIDKVISHNKYEKPSFNYDITLVRVNKKILFNDYVRQLCLSDVIVPVGTNCIVAGWGDTECK